jgi:hypothetical protein
VDRYGQTDTLVTSTDVATSGAGTAAPEGAAGNADYGAWPWEVMLATVLGIAAPDRSEVTGQPWLMTQQNGEGDAGSHLIWTAGWDTGPDGAGASSIHVYLSPGLYTAGGAWDTFLTAPATALAGVPGQDYTGLPLSPPTFQSASVAVTSVTNWLAAAADQFSALHAQAASGSAAEFQGNLATEVTELLDGLRASLSAMHEQMVSPEAYGTSIGTAGDAATQFLANLMSAYLAWTQVPAHSPLGAVVQVLEGIASPDANGAATIPDPRNTPFGDLTSPDVWPAVEQAAKSLWTGLLTGQSPGFAGLDPQTRAALSKLTGQLAATSAAVVPVIGPGLPSRQQAPASTGAGQGAPGTPPPGQPPAPAAGAGAPGAQAANGPQLTAGAGPGAGTGPNLGAGTGPNPGAGTGPNLGAGPAAGPVGPVAAGAQAGGPAGAPLAVLATGSVAASAGAGAAGPGSTPASPGGSAGPDGAPSQAADLADLPGAGPAAGVAGPTIGVAGPGGAGAGSEDPAAVAVAADLPGLTGALARPSVLAGAIGATAGDRADDATRPRSDSAGFTGTIGHLPRAGHKDGGPGPHSAQQHDGGRKKALPVGLRQAPTAGFSLGRDPHGAVLQQAAVPTVTARPPAVVSSPVNSQLIPGAGALGGTAPGGTAPGGTTAALSAGAGAPGGTAATLPPGGTAAAGPASPATSTGPGGLGTPAGAMGEQVMLGRGTTGGAGAGGPMMMPPGGMRGGGQAGQAGQERMRRAYLPEEEESWDAGPGPAGVVLGADQHDQHDQHGDDTEPEFVSVPSAAVGIGAQPDQAHAAEEI